MSVDNPGSDVTVRDQDGHLPERFENPGLPPHVHRMGDTDPAAANRSERQIVVLRFFHDLDQYEIAGRVGCSQMHVSRLLRRALDRLRAQLLVG